MVKLARLYGVSASRLLRERSGIESRPAAMTPKKPDPAALETARAVMKRMLEAPPAPHEAKASGRRKVAKKRKK